MDKSLYEVVLANDNTTDKTFEKIERYKDKIDFVYTEMTRDVHCPGNTRNAGIEVATGEWITFIDHDDKYEPDVFLKVKEYLESNDNNYFIGTYIRQFEDRTENVEFEMANPQDCGTFVHGKFYNRKNLIEKYHLRFKADMRGSEDIYFNRMTSMVLLVIGFIPNMFLPYLPIFTYHWNNVLTSESHNQMKDGMWDSHTNFFFKDYLESNFIPLLWGIENLQDENQKNDLISTLPWVYLLAYFYFESLRYKILDNVAGEDYMYMHQWKMAILNYMSIEHLIGVCYNDYEGYVNNKERTMRTTGPFTEVESFRDFVYRI